MPWAPIPAEAQIPAQVVVPAPATSTGDLQNRVQSLEQSDDTQDAILADHETRIDAIEAVIPPGRACRFTLPANQNVNSTPGNVENLLNLSTVVFNDDPVLYSIEPTGRLRIAEAGLYSFTLITAVLVQTQPLTRAAATPFLNDVTGIGVGLTEYATIAVGDVVSMIATGVVKLTAGQFYTSYSTLRSAINSTHVALAGSTRIVVIKLD